MIELKGVLFKDRQKDTLLSAGQLKIDISMLALLSKKILVSKLVLEDVTAHVYRRWPDTNFNFTYIIDAFSGDKDNTEKGVQPADKKATPFTFDVDKVNLDNIHIRFDDETGGSKLAVDLQKLRLRMRKMDPGQLLFNAKSLEVEGLHTQYRQDTSYIVSNDTSKAKPLQLKLDDLQLKGIAVHFESSLSRFLLDVQLGNLSARPEDIDLEGQEININDLSLSDTRTLIVVGRQSPLPAKADSVIDTLTEQGWRIKVKDINLAGIDVKMDNENRLRQSTGMDYAHLDVKNLSFQAKNIAYASDNISGTIQHLALQEKSGLEVQELKTQFAYHSKGASLRNLYLQTTHTILKDNIEVAYPSLDELRRHMETLQLNVSLSSSIIGVRDILIFSPGLIKQDFFRQNRNGRVWLDTKIAGRLNKLDIDKFQLRGLGKTVVSIRGKINGLPDAAKISYNLRINNLRSSREDIETMLPAEVLADIRIPDGFGAVGTISGTIKDYKADLDIMSTDGHAVINGYLFMSGGKGREKYELALHTYDLDIGHILRKDTLLGPVSVQLTAKGQGFDVKTMSAAADGVIEAARIRGYNYTNIRFRGNVAQQLGELHLKSSDPNAHFDVKGHANFTAQYAALVADINIDSINLQALKLYEKEMRIQARIHADIASLNPDYPDGVVVINKPVVASNGRTYVLDSMYVSSKPNDSGQNIVLDMDFLKASLTGQVPLTKVATVVQEHINRHYAMLPTNDVKIGKTDTLHVYRPFDYNFRLNALVREKPQLYAFLPDLKHMDTVHIEGIVNNRSLVIRANAPRIEYGDNILEQIKVKVDERDSALTYQVSLDKFSRGKILLLNTNLEGNVTTNQVLADLTIDDEKQKQRFSLSAVFRQEGEESSIQIGNGMKLNYRDWQVAQPNKIAFSKAGFYVQGLEMNSSGSSISVNSKTPEYNAPLSAVILNFELSDVTRIVNNDTLWVNGLLNGSVDIQQMEPQAIVKADLNIRDLSVLNDTIGNLAVVANTAEAGIINTDVRVTGRDNDIQVTGKYYTKPVGANDFDFDLDIRALNVRSVEGLAQHHLRNSSGYIRGKLEVKGTASKPLVTGELRTDQLITNISMLNTPMRMPSEKIVFREDEIRFDRFTIMDTAGNKAVINGSVITRDYRNMRLDLSLRTNEWHALNSSAADNKLFYGNLVLTTNLDISGTISAPDINGRLSILKGTKMTVVLPENNPGLETSAGIVNFIDKSYPGRIRTYAPKDTDTIRIVSLSAGSNINVNIGVDDDAEFSIVIDQATGDFLRVRGEASLNASLTPGGDLSLTGIYELKEGLYELNYNLIKRRFNIRKGSTIVFAGDPMRSQINVTAVYRANISPYDLVDRMVSDPAQLNYYRQPIPFDIELMMNGPLMKPILNFNITLPQNTAFRLPGDGVEIVQSKLSQLRTDISELNKQVFAVLILNRFITEDPLSNGGPGMAFTAKQSVSRFIGEQLNQVASQVVKGVDLTVDLTSTEDYTSGQRAERTDLNIAASKRLLDDRLKITVGNNFELEGPQSNAKQQNSSLIPGNLAADYSLSADGRYTVRAYRVTQDQGVLQGFVTETGLNFIISIDYNRFWSIFKKRKPRKREQENKSDTTKTSFRYRDDTLQQQLVIRSDTNYSKTYWNFGF